jgi:hypothetical protein
MWKPLHWAACAFIVMGSAVVLLAVSRQLTVDTAVQLFVTVALLSVTLYYALYSGALVEDTRRGAQPLLILRVIPASGPAGEPFFQVQNVGRGAALYPVAYWTEQGPDRDLIAAFKRSLDQGGRDRHGPNPHQVLAPEQFEDCWLPRQVFQVDMSGERKREMTVQCQDPRTGKKLTSRWEVSAEAEFRWVKLLSRDES